MKKTFIPISYLLLIFLSISSNAQITTASQWAWMKGDNTTNATGVYGTQGVASAANKPGARTGSVSWTDAAGKFWLFGGHGISGTGGFSDLWKYDPASNQWTWMKGDNTQNQPGVYGTKGIAAAINKPGSRSSGATWIDASGNLWLFGGSGRDEGGGGGQLSDLWKYNPSINQWTWVNGPSIAFQGGVYGTMGMAAASNMPGARYSSASWMDASGNLWLFGGRGYDGYNSGFNDITGSLNDLWKYNTATNQWTWVKGSNSINQQGVYGIQGTPATGNTPGARSESNSWTDITGNLWLFGGGLFNDIWKYNPTTNQWTWVKGESIPGSQGVFGTLGVANSANTPSGRANSISWKDADGDFWIFGGSSYVPIVNALLNDLWKYDPASNQWTWMKGSNTAFQQGVYGTMGTAAATNLPGARYIGTSWRDANGNLWLFGGYGYPISGSGLLNDLWKLSNAAVLPVTLSSIKAYQQNSTITVEWKVQNETGIKHYEIEKSADGILFTKAAVRAATGNRMSTVNYIWVDINAITGNNFYRVRSVGLDGEVKYSQVIKVTIGKGQPRYEVYPNPVSNGTIQLQFINQLKGVYELRLLNTHGQVMLTNKIVHGGGSSTEAIQFNSQLARGNYTLVVIAPDRTWTAIKIIY